MPTRILPIALAAPGCERLERFAHDQDHDPVQLVCRIVMGVTGQARVPGDAPAILTREVNHFAEPTAALATDQDADGLALPGGLRTRPTLSGTLRSRLPGEGAR